MVICRQNCPWDRVCANHYTAGDFRSEDGARPLLSLKNGEVHCETIHSPGDGYEAHELPINVDHNSYQSPFGEYYASVLWRQLAEKENDYQI